MAIQHSPAQAESTAREVSRQRRPLCPNASAGFSAPTMSGRIKSVKNNFDLCEQQGFPDFRRLTVEVGREQDIDMVMSELLKDPTVASVEREEAYYVPSDIIPNDPSFGAKWDHTQLRAPEVWEILKDLPREEKVVCVIDTG